MPSDATVSVVIPAYNAERYLGEAIESALGQTHPPAEVIVVDDGSTDGSLAVAERYPDVLCIPQPNSGCSAARNVGIAQSRGEYISFLDADDLWDSRKLELQLAVLESDEAPEIVFGLVRQFMTPDATEETKRRFRVPEQLQKGYFVSCMLIRREDFDRVGPFDVSLPYGEGVDWVARARAVPLRERMIDYVVLSRRIHGANKMAEADSASDFARVVKMQLDRRRAAAAAQRDEGRDQ